MALLSATQVHELRDPKASAQHVENIAIDDQRLRDIETVSLVVTELKTDFTLQPIILDEIRADELLVEMKFSGICTAQYACPPAPSLAHCLQVTPISFCSKVYCPWSNFPPSLDMKAQVL